MSTLAPTQSSSNMQKVAPFIADGIAILLYLATSNWLVSRFSRNADDLSALGDAAILLVCHLLFLIGIAQLRRLGRPSGIALLSNRWFVGVVCTLYAVAFVFGVADLTGYLDTLFTVDFGDMGNAYYFLVTPAVYLVVGLLYLLLLRQPIDEVENDRHGLVPLMLLNVMLVAAAAFAQTFMATTFEAQPPLITVAVSFVTLTALFILPRIIYCTRTRNWLGLISFDLMLTVLAVLPLIFR